LLTSFYRFFPRHGVSFDGMMCSSAKLEDPECSPFIRLVRSFAAQVHHVQHRSIRSSAIAG
jgi:hypothetical protein